MKEWRYIDGVLVEHTINGVRQLLNKNSAIISDPLSVHRQVAPEFGPGTELKKLLAKLSLKPAPNCKCNRHIAEMNQKGVVWCEENTDTIVGWLKEESERAKLPFTSIGARIIVRRAIRNANKRALA